MRSFWSEPFLWIHLAGLAAVPLCLELCWLGLAVGDPVFPVWLEFVLVAGIGIAPVLLMQLTRPFYIFSILAVAMKPEQVTPQQRTILSLFKTPINRLLAGLVAVFMLWVLWQIYRVAPVVAVVAPFPPSWRLAGLFLAGVAFFASNLFLQVSVSVLGVLLTSEAAFAGTEPYPLEKIPQEFSVPGLRVNQILPPVVTDLPPATTASPQTSSDTK
jgi:hypothetical protein